MKIYLSGSVKKGSSDNRPSHSFWTPEDEMTIRNLISPDVVLMNPSKTSIRRTDYFANYGCDLLLVEQADVVLADLRTEKGIGVGAELMYASSIGTPVVSWLPPNSYYRRDLTDVLGEDLKGWIHPFAYSLSDVISDTLEDACSAILRSKGLLHKDQNKRPRKAIDHFTHLYPSYRDVI